LPKTQKNAFDLSNLHKTSRTSDNFILGCIGKQQSTVNVTKLFKNYSNL